LEQQRFTWPQTGEDALAIDGDQLRWLLSGLDITSAYRPLSYSAVA
jgi:IS66 Orf2 like protein